MTGGDNGGRVSPGSARAPEATCARRPPRPRPRRAAVIAALVIGSLLVVAQPAWAKVLVLTFRGANGAKVQAAVQSALVATGQDASAGETSFEDAAVLIGCDAASDDCADQVLTTLAVDEVVFGTSSKSGEIVITRAALGKPRRTTKVRVEAGAGLEPAVTPGVKDLYQEDAPQDAPPPTAPPVASPPGEPDLSASSLETRAATTPEVQRGAAPRAGANRRWAVVSFSAAGVTTMTGLLLWLRASSLQDDIDQAPDDTAAQLAALRDLEGQAQTAATWGNTMIVVGAGLAGLGTYFWIKDHRRRERPSAAALRPMLLHDGVGVVLTFEGR